MNFAYAFENKRTYTTKYQYYGNAVKMIIGRIKITGGAAFFLTCYNIIFVTL